MDTLHLDDLPLEMSIYHGNFPAMFDIPWPIPMESPAPSGKRPSCGRGPTWQRISRNLRWSPPAITQINREFLQRKSPKKKTHNRGLSWKTNCVYYTIYMIIWLLWIYIYTHRSICETSNVDIWEIGIVEVLSCVRINNHNLAFIIMVFNRFNNQKMHNEQP